MSGFIFLFFFHLNNPTFFQKIQVMYILLKRSKNIYTENKFYNGNSRIKIQ